jgi:hypothetical protein
LQSPSDFFRQGNSYKEPLSHTENVSNSRVFLYNQYR